MSYFTILDIIESGNYVKHELNSVTESMELVTSDYEFISYDSEKTFSMKASYASEMCMRGYMWWAVDLIDEAFILNYESPTISPTSKEPTFSPTPKEITPAPTLIVPTTKAPFVEHPCDRKAKMSVNIGYYQSWAVWRNGCSVVTPEDIDVEGMGYTHLVYSFASISSSLTLQAWEGNDSEHFPRMAQFNALKQKYPGLKTLLSVGGRTHNDPGELCDRFSRSSATAESRQKFADSVVTFLNAVSKTLCSH